MARLRSLYGSSPLHLVALVASFALAAYAAAKVLGGSGALNFVLWFVGAAVLHDFVLLPLYTVLDRIAGRVGPGRSRRLGPGAVNFVRVPALLSGLAFLVYFPLILDLPAQGFRATTGIGADVYLGRWLALTAGLFVVSGIALALRLRRARSAPAAA